MQKTKDPLIFIVQDNLIYKDLLVGYLKQRKFKNIKTFISGEECLNSIKLGPDIVVLDYTLNGISGLELMRRVKAEHPETDFIFLSSQNSLEVAVKLMKLGASDYIIKDPEAPHNLIHSIEFLISSGKAKKIKKDFQIGVVGFFLILFFIILVIVVVAILLGDTTMARI